MIRQVKTQSDDPISSIKLDGNKYSFLTQKNKLSLYNLSNGVEIINYETYTNSNLNVIEIMSDDKIVSGSNQILIHDKLRKVPIRKFENVQVDYRGKIIRDLKPLNSNGILISCDIDLKLWDLRQSNKYKPIQQFSNSMDYLNSCDYNSNNNEFLISCGGNDGKLYTYDIRKGLLNIDDKFNKNPITKVNYDHNNNNSNNVLINLLNQGPLLFDYKINLINYELVKDEKDTNYRIDCKFILDGFITGSEFGKLYKYNQLTGVSVINICLNEANNGLILGALDVAENQIVVGSGNGMVYIV